MERILVEIKGLCPILFNRFTEKAQEGLIKGSSGKRLSKEDKLKEAEDKVYRKKGVKEIGIQAVAIKKTLIEGCGLTSIKIGKRSAVGYLKGGVFLEEDFVPIIKKPKPDGIHECSGRIPPRTGARAMIYRPYVDTGWKALFHLIIAHPRISIDIVKNALDEAGLIVGLLDHRPDFGRFIVTKFEILEVS